MNLLEEIEKVKLEGYSEANGFGKNRKAAWKSLKNPCVQIPL